MTLPAGKREVDVIVPQVGEAIAEAIVVRWYKAEGDAVRKGDVLFELDLAKSTVEVEAFDDGILGRILAPAESAVVPLQKVATLLVADGVAEPSVAPVLSSLVTANEAPNPAVPAPALRAERNGSASVSPRARRRAKELGVNLADVEPLAGTMVTAADVERAAAGRNSAPRSIATSTPDVVAESEVPIERLSRARAVVAARMTSSKQHVPHFYLMSDVDMSAVVALRASVPPSGRAPTVTAILVGAAAAALKANPALNASFADGGLARRARVSIGVAVATDDGLRVPVIADADELGVTEIDERLRDAAERARSGRLRDTDVGPRSLVVSNLGMEGVDAFLAIIDEPDPLILTAGRIRDAVVAIDGTVGVRPVATISVSADHRVIDGREAARFLADVGRFLAEPLKEAR